MAKTFHIRDIGGKKRNVWVLTVPMEIASQLDPNLRFVCELTEDGLLYRPVERHREPQLPSWTRKGDRRKT